MVERQNDAKAKHLRRRQRGYKLPCHICGNEINYDAHYLDPLSFQLDHRVPVSLGGPAYDPNNCASSHRACNRGRSNAIDHITITAAAELGIALPTPSHHTTGPQHAPDGQHCTHCNGTHNPRPGITYITARHW